MCDGVYESRGKQFKFNDHVCAEMMLGPDEKLSGRLVQVRVGCGQFGSDVYLVRLRDGSLMTWENCMIRRVDDEQFIDAFYRSNGREPPAVPFQDYDRGDSVDVEYTIGGEFPETGFVVCAPSQPQTPGILAITETDSSINIKTIG